MVKCNMTPEEQERALKLWDGSLTVAELTQAKAFFERFLFYDSWGRRNYREYICPNCGGFEINGPRVKDLYVENPFVYHHGERASCPICGGEFTLICLGRMRNMSSLKRWAKLAFFRAVDGVLTISAGQACMEYSFDDLDPYPEYYETARYVVEPGKRQMWKQTNWWDADQRQHFYSPQPTKSFTEPFACTHYYGMSWITGELNFIGVEAIYDTSMRYCQLEKFVEDAWGAYFYDYGETPTPLRGVIQYLGEYSAKPQIEMLVKLGHVDVVGALLERGSLPRGLVNWRAKSPAGFFRLSKTEYKDFRDQECKLNDLERWREDQPAGLDFGEYICACAFLGSERSKFFNRYQAHELPIKKALAWIREQTPIGAGGAETVRLWDDYLNMAARLEREMTFRRNLLPEDLRQEHDAAAELLNRMEKQKTIAEYGVRYKKLKKTYAYSDGELTVVVPPSAKSIQREGQALQHCVGGYAPRHVKGATTILFLRKAEHLKTPYVTIEINDADFTIRQVHGYKNEMDGAENPKKRHAAFFDEWLTWLKRGSPRTRKGDPIRPKKNNEEVKTA